MIFKKSLTFEKFLYEDLGGSKKKLFFTFAFETIKQANIFYKFDLYVEYETWDIGPLQACLLCTFKTSKRNKYSVNISKQTEN